MPTEKLNLKICSWKQNENCLICDTDDIAKKVIIKLEQFEKWLLKNDYLYYEDHVISSPQDKRTLRFAGISGYFSKEKQFIFTYNPFPRESGEPHFIIQNGEKKLLTFELEKTLMQEFANIKGFIPLPMETLQKRIL